MSSAERVWKQPLEPAFSPFGTIRRAAVHSRLTICWMALQLASDYAAVAGVLWLSCRAWQFRFAPSAMVISANGVAVLTILLFKHYHLYDASSAVLHVSETERILRSAAVMFCAVFASVLLLHDRYLRFWPVLVITLLVAVVAVLVERCVCLALVRWAHEKGYGLRRVLICGACRGAELFRKLDQNPRLGLLCMGFPDDRVGIHEVCEPCANAVMLSAWDDLRETIHREAIDEIILADPPDNFIDILNQCDQMQVSVSLLPGALERYRPWFSFQLHDGMLLARRRYAAKSLVTTVAKRLMDVVLASLLLVLLGPVLLLIALLITPDSPGPALFRQNRVGKDGRVFVILKFRSMHIDAPAYDRSPASSHDPRITRIGRILRRTSFDELPQLLNVLRGDMSLVGPRPEMPFIVAQYSPMEYARLRIKPGITGLWQISPARSKPIHENLEYDLHYIEHQNFFLDLAILLSTVTTVIRGIGAY
jgi:exopolysaccharide biosynthesis polyprenyl glycosylphosphotransferase